MTPAQADFIEKYGHGVADDLLLVIRAERERCASIADEEEAQSDPRNPEFDAGYRQCAGDIARRIRQLT